MCRLNIMGVILWKKKLSSGRLHRLVLSDRHSGSVTGVNDVVSFDENEIVLDTEMGLLTIRGKELHVKRLTLEKGEAGSGRPDRQFKLQL